MRYSMQNGQKFSSRNFWFTSHDRKKGENLEYLSIE